MTHKERCTALEKLVRKSVTEAKRDGWILAQGSWRLDAPDGADERGTVCLVGAIGVTRDARCGGRPKDVRPLIRNGESELIDDAVLHWLSEGFEGALSPEDHVGDGKPIVGVEHEDFTYLQFAWKLGAELGEDAPSVDEYEDRWLDEHYDDDF